MGYYVKVEENVKQVIQLRLKPFYLSMDGQKTIKCLNTSSIRSSGNGLWLHRN